MRRRVKAFTAVEVTMVAAVIAILALIILPLFQKRAEAAKKAAVQDDLQGLAKAEILANADTSWYFRLQDLDNTQLYPGDSDQRDISVPYAIWDRALFDSERATLANRWQGPYIAVQTNSSTLLGEARDIWSSIGSTAFISQNYLGKYPIPLLEDLRADAGLSSITDNDDDKLPTDPWGGYYIFYAPGSETDYDFSNAVVYSMGANGLPGDGSEENFDQNNLDRDSTIPSHLGNGDDYKFVF